MNASDILAANSLVWPLCFLLFGLLVLRQVREDVRPIFRGIVSGLAAKAQSNSVQWGIGLLMATLGSMTATIEVAHAMGWVFIEMGAKIATPFIATLVTLSMKSPIREPQDLPPAAAPANITTEQLTTTKQP